MDEAVFVSLFSGVGGLDLAVEEVFGSRPTLLCEADPYCRAVLQREWPDVPCEEDVRTVCLETFRSSVEASPAKTSATPGSEPASRATDPDSGWKWRGAFAIYDPPSSSWRMSAGSLFEASTVYSETYPTAGTMRNGRLFERQTLGPRTSGPASSSSPYDAPYPTPSATPYGSSGNGSGNNVDSRGRPSLETMAQTWATPVAVDSKELTSPRGRGLLTDQMRSHQDPARWPTPVTTDSKSSARGTTTTGIMHDGASLTDAMRSHRGLATTTPGKNGADKPVLSPEFVEALMGLRPGWTLVDDGTASSCLETEWCRSKLGMRSRGSSSEPSTTD